MTKDNAEGTQSWKVKLTLARQETVYESLSIEGTLVAARAPGSRPPAGTRGNVDGGALGGPPRLRPNKGKVVLTRRKQ